MVTPAHHFPTGVVLDGERRRELIQWATDGGLIIEDDYDAEHRYDRPPVPALRTMLPDRVIYAGSVSKLLAPALRIGWMLAPPQYKDELIARKRLADLGNAGLPQLTLASLMESGELERQLRFLRRRHRTRRDAMVSAIRNHLPTATIHGAAAGLHLTITFETGKRHRAGRSRPGSRCENPSPLLALPTPARPRPGPRLRRPHPHRNHRGHHHDREGPLIGLHQFARPASFMNAGNRMPRIAVASTSTATAIPIPIIFRYTTPPVA